MERMIAYLTHFLAFVFGFAIAAIMAAVPRDDV
jgi:hypothetical protein